MMNKRWRLTIAVLIFFFLKCVFVEMVGQFFGQYYRYLAARRVKGARDALCQGSLDAIQYQPAPLAVRGFRSDECAVADYGRCYRG